MKVLHLTQCMRPPYRFFEQFDHALWFWTRLRETFPEVYAALLMPNHPHLEVPEPDLDDALERFSAVCQRFARRVGVSRLWLPFGERSPVVGRGNDGVVARYIELNPCRKSLCASPLAWDFSTFRERIGAVADPWSRPRSLRALVPRSLLTSQESRLQRYVRYVMSVDAVTDRSPVNLALPAASGMPSASLSNIARASAAALLRLPNEVRQRGPVRDLFIHLARDQAVGTTASLMEMAGVSRPTLWRTLQRPASSAALSAARTCLADPRLLLVRGAPYPLHFAPDPAPRFSADQRR